MDEADLVGTMNKGIRSTTSTEENVDDYDYDDAPEESGWTVYFDDFFSNNNRELNIHHSSSSAATTFDDQYGTTSTNSDLVSDAGSCTAVWNNYQLSSPAPPNPIHVGRLPADHNYKNKLRFLNRTAIIRSRSGSGSGGGGGVGGVLDNNNNNIIIEDALEDTASSPVNSPKVSDRPHMKQFDQLMMMNTPTKILNHTTSLRNKGGGGVSGHFSELHTTDERNANLIHHHHQLATTTAAAVQTGFNNIGRENYECTELKKKGLCLVPMSMFLNYFGTTN